MNVSASDVSDMLSKARSRTLANDDQRLQALRSQANAGVRQAQNWLNEINEAGGASDGSVNRVI